MGATAVPENKQPIAGFPNIQFLLLEA